MALVNDGKQRPQSSFEITSTAPADVAFVASPRNILVTRVGLSAKTQRVEYLGELEVKQIFETNTLALDELDIVLEIPRTRFSFQQDADTPDQDLALVADGHELVIADYPYSQLRVNTLSFKKRNSDGARLRHQLTKVLKKMPNLELEEIAPVVLSYLEQRSYDAWESSPLRLTASHFAGIHGRTFEGTPRQITISYQRGKAKPQLPGHVFGCTNDYKACQSSLYVELLPLLELAEVGKLRIRDHRQSKPGQSYAPIYPDEPLRGKASTVLDWAIEQAMAGPLNYSQWIEKRGSFASEYAQELFMQHYSRLELASHKARSSHL